MGPKPRSRERRQSPEAIDSSKLTSSSSFPPTSPTAPTAGMTVGILAELLKRITASASAEPVSLLYRSADKEAQFRFPGGLAWGVCVLGALAFLFH